MMAKSHSLEFLKNKGLYQNTLIILSGDHGESLGEHGEKTHGFFIYNATLHVPLIIHLPGDMHARTVQNLVNLADIMPTVLAAKPAADHLPEERRQRPQPVCRNFPSAPALQLERIAWSGNGKLSLY